jgi:hypothetical protein
MGGALGRIGLEPARRYERSRPGELVHIDIKKLAAFRLPASGSALISRTDMLGSCT